MWVVGLPELKSTLSLFPWRIVMFLKRQPMFLLAVRGCESLTLTLALGLAILLATAMSVAAQTTSGSITGKIANDWQLSGVYHYQSGAPYSAGFSVTGY